MEKTEGHHVVFLDKQAFLVESYHLKVMQVVFLWCFIHFLHNLKATRDCISNIFHFIVAKELSIFLFKARVRCCLSTETF